MSGSPSQNGNNGRDVRGRFTVGNPGGPGNPTAAAVGRLRHALLAAVTPEELTAVVQALLGKAKSGDVPAATLLLRYLLGEPVAADVIESLGELQARLRALAAGQGGAQC